MELVVYDVEGVDNNDWRELAHWFTFWTIDEKR